MNTPLYNFQYLYIVNGEAQNVRAIKNTNFLNYFEDKIAKFENDLNLEAQILGFEKKINFNFELENLNFNKNDHEFQILENINKNLSVENDSISFDDSIKRKKSFEDIADFYSLFSFINNCSNKNFPEVLDPKILNCLNGKDEICEIKNNLMKNLEIFNDFSKEKIESDQQNFMFGNVINNCHIKNLNLNCFNTTNDSTDDKKKNIYDESNDVNKDNKITLNENNFINYEKIFDKKETSILKKKILRNSHSNKIEKIDGKYDGKEIQSDFKNKKILLKNKKYVYSHKDDRAIKEAFDNLDRKKNGKNLLNPNSENKKYSYNPHFPDSNNSDNSLNKNLIFLIEKFPKNYNQNIFGDYLKEKNYSNSPNLNLKFSSLNNYLDDENKINDDLIKNAFNISNDVIPTKPKKEKFKRNYLGKSRKSKFRGVSRNGNQWQVLIMIKNSKRYIGSYSSEEKAAKAYDKVAIHYHKTKAKTNFYYQESEIKQILSEPPLIYI